MTVAAGAAVVGPGVTVAGGAGWGDTYGIGLAPPLPIGGGVGGGVAASATLSPEGEPNVKIAAAAMPPAMVRKKEDVFMGVGAFWRAGKASFFDMLVIMLRL